MYYLFHLCFTVCLSLLVGCDGNSFRDFAFSFNLAEPSLAELNYDDAGLAQITAHIANQGDDEEFVLNEYRWIKERGLSCQNEVAEESNRCITRHNETHKVELNKKLYLILSSVAIEQSIASISDIPLGLEKQASSKSHSQRTHLEYAKAAGVLSFISADDTLYTADLINKKILLDNVEPSISSVRTVRNLSLSPNGELVAVAKKNYVDIFGSRFGFISRLDGPHNAFFVSNKYLLVYGGNELSLYDLTQNKFLSSSGELPMKRVSAGYSRGQSGVYFWSFYGSKLGFYSLDASSGLIESKPKIFSFPENIRGAIVDVVIGDSKAVIFTTNSIVDFNLDTATFSLITQYGVQTLVESVLLDDSYVVFSGTHRTNRNLKRVAKVLNLDGGALASLPGLSEQAFSVSSLGAHRSAVMGSSLGVKFYDFNPELLRFSKFEPAQQKKRKSVTSKSVEKSRVAPKKSIYRCEGLDGKMSYSDTKCSKEAKLVQVEEQKISRNEYAHQKPVKVSKGEEGIQQALMQGLIRVASSDDYMMWSNKNENSERLSTYLRTPNKYVILKPIAFSGGFGGANAKVFIVNDDRLAPGGSIGHSTVLFTNSGACQGPFCRL